MAFANGSDRRVAIVAEATPGTTPTTPTLQILRTVTADLIIGRPKARTGERKANRRTSQVYKSLAGVSASIAMELADDDGFDLLLTSALNGAWSTNVLKDSTTAAPFTVEATDEMGATDAFTRLRGMEVDGMSFTLAPGEPIRVSIDMIGIDGIYDTAIVSGATYTAAGTELVVCGTDFTLTDFFGISSPQIRSMTLNIRNNLRPRHSLNSGVSPYPFGVAHGPFEVTGEVVCYAQDNTVLALNTGDVQNDLQFTVGFANKKYSFDMLTCAVVDGKRSDGGNSGDIMDTISFMALDDTGDNSALKITRNVA